MEPKVYIEKRLAELRESSKVVPESDKTGQIYRLLMSKKFRKYAVTPEYDKHIRDAIALNIANNEAIKLTLVFGGYKLWRLDESPEPDWAELFSLMYYAKWLKPICEIYAPGVWLDFFSDDAVLEYMDNVPREDTERYVQGFRRLLEFFKSYVPENMRITLNRVEDRYESAADFIEDLRRSVKKVEEVHGDKTLELTPEQRAVIELNVKLLPGQSEDPTWREKVFLIHEGYAQISRRRPYYRTPDKIMLITRPLPNSLAVGTTKRSVMKFWIGAGVLERVGDEYVENIFSPGQLARVDAEWCPLVLEGLNGKNFSKIRVLRSAQ